MRLGDLDALKEKAETVTLWNGDIRRFVSYETIDNAPTVEPKQGKWIEGENGNIKCNKCGSEIRYSYLIGNKPDFPNFCPNCGTSMKGKEGTE